MEVIARHLNPVHGVNGAPFQRTSLRSCYLQLGFQKPGNLISQSGGIRNRAFPDGQHRPTLFSQFSYVLAVSLAIPISLRLPKLCIRLRRDFSESAVVQVPEASMNENDLLSTWQNEVRAAW
jgi:hypothetical protein